MSRSGYTDDCENIGLYRNAVERAIKGKLGQAFLRELAAALDAMPNKRLIEDELKDSEGDVCTLGALYLARQIDTTPVDYYDHTGMGKQLGIARSLVAEIEYENDEGTYRIETPEQRWQRMRQWVKDNLHD